MWLQKYVVMLFFLIYRGYRLFCTVVTYVLNGAF